MMDPIIEDLPFEIRGLSREAKFDWIVNQGIKDATADPLYGTPEETQVRYFRVGTRGRRFSDVSTAVEAGKVADRLALEKYEGRVRFDRQSKVVDRYLRSPAESRAGWLYIRCIPYPSLIGEGSGSDQH